jgi:hypothetical protein
MAIHTAKWVEIVNLLNKVAPEGTAERATIIGRYKINRVPLYDGQALLEAIYWRMPDLVPTPMTVAAQEYEEAITAQEIMNG